MKSTMIQRQTSQGLGRRSTAGCVTARPVGRTLSVQVFAKKGKSRGALRQSAGVPGTPGMVGPGQAQVAQDARTPEVDPEQAEMVLFFRARNVQVGKAPAMKETPWCPLSVMKAGAPGTTLVGLLETPWGKKLYSNLLIKQIGQNLYKDKELMAANIRKNIPQFANVPTKNFDYAFKIRDKSRPEAWKDAVNLTEIPPENLCVVNPLDTMKAFFSPDNLATMFKSA